MKKLIFAIIAVLLLCSLAIAATLEGIKLEGVTITGQAAVVTTGNIIDHLGNSLVTHTPDNLQSQN